MPPKKKAAAEPEAPKVPRSLYTLEPVGRRYDEIFRDVLDLRGDGWYSARTHKAF